MNLKYKIKTYEGTESETEIELSIFDHENHSDYSIEVLSGEAKGQRGCGYKTWNDASVAGFNRAAAYGNGSFPLKALSADNRCYI